jgi:hypothetical protein
VHLLVKELKLIAKMNGEYNLKYFIFVCEVLGCFVNNNN